jgi:alpha-2-macroglobulin
MRKTILLFICLLYFSSQLIAQTNLNQIARKSHYQLAYRITTQELEKMILLDSISIDAFLQRNDGKLLPLNTELDDSLPIGHYVIISSKEYFAQAKIYVHTNLSPYLQNNKDRAQLIVRNAKADSLENVDVYVKNKKLEWNPATKSFWLPTKSPKDIVLKICSKSDTIYSTVDIENEARTPIGQQKWLRIKSAFPLKQIIWFGKQIVSIFKKKRKPYGSLETGYILFNQPKFKPQDSVKWKAYLVDKKHFKPYTKELNVFIEYNKNSSLKTVYLSKQQSANDGAYFSAFKLGDSIPTDISCRLILKDKDDNILLSEQFRIEDYVVDEIAKQSIEFNSTKIFKGDTIQVQLEAKDANGLNLLEGKAKVSLLFYKVDQFYKDTLLIPDTIWSTVIKLNAEGKTKLDIPTENFPKADMELTLLTNFTNSSNESHEESKNLQYTYERNGIFAEVIEDSLSINFVEQNQAKKQKFILEYDIFDQSVRDTIITPTKVKISAFASTYRILAFEGKNNHVEKVEINDNYRIMGNRLSIMDTLGIELYNPYGVEVRYSVFDNGKMIASGISAEKLILWKQQTNAKKVLDFTWQYFWGGEEKIENLSLSIFDKILNVKANGETSIYPGQKTSINVQVGDYMNYPVADADITAVSYNSQLSKNIRLPNIPMPYKIYGRGRISRDEYILDESPYLFKSYKLYNYKELQKKLGLDTMKYYQLLFPDANGKDMPTLIADIIPQIAIHLTDHGVPQEIVILYINKQPVYFNAVTKKFAYSFEAFAGFNQIGIRLAEKYIEIDSVYVQSHYKHDYSFELENLPTNSTVSQQPNFFTDVEKSILNQALMSVSKNTGWIWQNKSLVYIEGDNYNFYTKEIIGPFNNSDSLHFFQPNKFDITVNKEIGYTYTFSPKMARLERFQILKPYTKEFIQSKSNNWILGDTIPQTPNIVYKPVALKSKIVFNPSFTNNWNKIEGKGNLILTLTKDSGYKYIVLKKQTASSEKEKIFALNNYHYEYKNLDAGKYSIVLITSNDLFQNLDDIEIQSNKTTCINCNRIIFATRNKLIEDLQAEILIAQNKKDSIEQLRYKVEDRINTAYSNQTTNFVITGIVKDKKGKHPIPSASIIVVENNKGTFTDLNGSFKLFVNSNEQCTISITAIGYKSITKNVNFNQLNTTAVSIELEQTNLSLSEVIVTGYGTTRKKAMVGSIAVLSSNELQNTLSGKVPGLQIDGYSSSVRLRGISSYGGESNPIYIVDGIIMESLPSKLSPEMISQMEMMNGEQASIIYGSRAANGAIIITTNTKVNRTKFADYAFWQPNLRTDENGNVKFEVEYPDNITGWQTYVYAAKPNKGFGRSSLYTQSFKPILAQMNTPQFLIEGDESSIIGKNVNYTSDDYNVQTQFDLNGKNIYHSKHFLSQKSSIIDTISIQTQNSDTLKMHLELQTSTGFRDAEEKEIPVLQKGTNETVGAFWALGQDSAFTFQPLAGKGSIQIFAQNNTIDLLLAEIEHVKKYPYWCMEQTASKLIALQMEKTIKKSLNLSFEGEKEIKRILLKLQKSQLFDGGWGWWENGNANLYITQHILNALSYFKDDALVKTNIRNGLLFLQNQLPSVINRADLLTCLLTMSELKHEMDYGSFVSKIPFDSLSQHQQWQYVRLLQNLKADYNKPISRLMKMGTNNLLGGVHWGDENYRWYSNATATTTLAFKVIETDSNYQNLLPKIVQYFIAKRNQGYWMNTYESASILSTILPYAMRSNPNFNAATKIEVESDSNFTITQFPFQKQLNNASPLKFKKTGGGLTYLTVYQHFFNKTPEPIQNNLRIQTYFEQKGKQLEQLKNGERVKLIVEVEALAEAEYVQIEIPIPAGCAYANKEKNPASSHQEFLKNKSILFIEILSKGVHQFEIDLVSRYAGNYQINPAKIELMYFPTFFGREKMKRILINNE